MDTPTAHIPQENVLTIDGGGNVGKSTAAKHIAQVLGWKVLQSGLFYRGFALICSRAGIDPKNRDHVRQLVGSYSDHIHLRNGVLMFDDQVLKDEDLRSQEIRDIVSQVAEYNFLRQAVLPKQRAEVYGCRGLVADGRDMGTTVFPEAKYKIFLSADDDTCAYREVANRTAAGEKDISFAVIRDSLVKRNAHDSNRGVSPLVPAPDAFHIDTSRLTREEVVQAIILFCKGKGLITASAA